MSTPIQIRSSTPTLRTTRPTVVQGDPWVLQVGEYYDWLEAQGSRYRSTPIFVDAGSTVAHRWDEPFVADRSMCTQPSVDGGADSPSPNALIRDRWHDLRVTAAENKSFTESTPIQSLAVDALDRAIPAGFVFGFGSGFLTLNANAPQGATSISLRRIFTDVAVLDNEVAKPNNGYFYQQGGGAPLITNLALVGNPDPYINNFDWADLKYACDGVAVSGMGTQCDNLLIDNFPGHGLWVSSPTATGTLTSVTLPWDRLECGLGYVSVTRCLSGITMLPTDGTFERLVAAGCRDYGVRLIGNAIQGGKIHAYGCGVGIHLPAGVFATHLEGESCHHGTIILDRSQIGSLTGFFNNNSALRVDGGHVHIGSVFIRHGDKETISDPHDTGYPAGYAVAFGSYGSFFNCPAFHVTALGTSNGVVLGNRGDVGPLQCMRIRGRIDVAGGTCEKGLHVKYSLSGSEIDLTVLGFETNVYIDDDAVLTGNKLVFRGASNGAIRWADGSTATFGDPRIPSSVSSANSVEFYVF